MDKRKTLKTEQQTEQISKWVSSEEGKREICAIVQDVERVTANLSEARRVEEKNLEQPITM
jgi:hypothetical protein